MQGRMYKFRMKMAESIAKDNELWLLESYDNERVIIWYIKDKSSYNNPLGRLPQFQVWNEDKRCFVGTSQKEAYAEYRKQIG